MKPPALDRRRALLCLSAIACVPWGALAAPADLPGDSVYRLQASLVNQDGQAFELASLRGSPMLASMFYSSCEMVCPLIFETIHQTLKALPAAQQRSVKVLMVSFDPARDTVAALKQTAQAHGCDARWTLARCDDGTVRKLAATLGIQYRRLASGEFNHSTLIDVLDPEGRIAARSAKLGAGDPALIQALRAAGSRLSPG
jgi:protein SCO1/2